MFTYINLIIIYNFMWINYCPIFFILMYFILIYRWLRTPSYIQWAFNKLTSVSKQSHNIDLQTTLKLVPFDQCSLILLFYIYIFVKGRQHWQQSPIVLKWVPVYLPFTITAWSFCRFLLFCFWHKCSFLVCKINEGN